MKSPFVRRVAIGVSAFVLVVVGALAAFLVFDWVQLERHARAAAQVPETAASIEAMAELPELPPEITLATVDLIRGRPDVMLVDVRDRGEYAAGHIEEAVWIPLGELPARLDELPRDAVIVTVCRSGRRSGEARDLLLGEGFAGAHNMSGGMRAWGHAGLDSGGS